MTTSTTPDSSAPRKSVLSLKTLQELYNPIAQALSKTDKLQAIHKATLKFALANKDWDTRTLWDIYNLAMSMENKLIDAGFDPDLLPAPPLRIIDLIPNEANPITPTVSITVMNPDDDIVLALKAIPGILGSPASHLWRTNASLESIVVPLRSLLSNHNVIVTDNAVAYLKTAKPINTSSVAPSIGILSLGVKNRVQVRFHKAEPAVEDQLKRISGLRWDGESRAFLAPASKLKEVVAIAKQYNIALDATAQAALEAHTAPLKYDGTFDGLRGVPITDLVCVDTPKAKRLAEFGVESIWDLLNLIPRRYLDRSTPTMIRDLKVDEEVGILAKITNINVDQRRRMLRISLSDGSGKIDLVYFNAVWQAKRFRVGDSVVAYGKVSEWISNTGRSVLSLSNPMLDPLGESTLPVIPIYPQSAKSRVTTSDIHFAVAETLARLDELVDSVPQSVRDNLDLMPRTDALRAVHLPTSLPEAEKGRHRLAFDELFRMQLALLSLKAQEEQEMGITHNPTGVLTDALLAGLTFELTGAQKRVYSEIREDLIKPAPMHRMLQGDVGSGKAQPLTSLVLTPSGFKTMGDMKIGDEVVTPNGEISRVNGVFPQGKRQVWKINFSDGSSVRADGDHLWSVRTSVMKSREYNHKIMTTKEITDDLYEKNGASKWHIDLIAAPELNSEGYRPIDPYLLGVILGDGSIKYGRVQITTGDEEMTSLISEVLPIGTKLIVKIPKRNPHLKVLDINAIRIEEITNQETYEYNANALIELYQKGHSLNQIAKVMPRSSGVIRNDLIKLNVKMRPNRSFPNPILDSLRELNLMGCGSHTKFIPNAYLNAPIKDRLAILQGLLDTDGGLDYKTGFNINYSTVSDQLAKDVAWIVRSLGGRARLVRRKRKSGLSWYISISMPIDMNPFRLSRKREALVTRVKYANPSKAIRSIVKDGIEEVQCISIDHPSKLYITDDFTITHNTMVAFLTLLSGVEGGYQGALMAPTGILAKQLYEELVERTSGMHDIYGNSLRVEYFSNELKGKKRKEILKDLAEGNIHLAVGTHALLVADVIFKNLGIIVVDELHRFGVNQRATLRDKGPTIVINGETKRIKNDVIIQSATPIPRTMALTFFGDLDVSILDELPPNRTPIKTHWLDSEIDLIDPEFEAWKKIRSEVDMGRQAFVVCALVEDNDKLELASAMQTFEDLSNGALHGLRTGLVYGQQPAIEKEETMRAFKDGELDVLIATTVIETGVNIPNASVIAILDCSRFGVAQLHQLRGRVGRGKYSSECFLIGKCTSATARTRMEALVASTDGFYLSEVDLENRSHGSLFGEAQSGASDLRVADLFLDKELIILAHEAALEIIQEDPRLERRPGLRNEVKNMLGEGAEEWLVKS